MLKSIAHLEGHTYRVTLANERGEIQSFDLSVEVSNDIRFVTWQSDFVAYFQHDLTHPALFEAVLAFDRAVEDERGPREGSSS